MMRTLGRMGQNPWNLPCFGRRTSHEIPAILVWSEESTVARRNLQEHQQLQEAWVVNQR